MPGSRLLALLPPMNESPMSSDDLHCQSILQSRRRAQLNRVYGRVVVFVGVMNTISSLFHSSAYKLVTDQMIGSRVIRVLRWVDRQMKRELVIR